MKKRLKPLKNKYKPMFETRKAIKPVKKQIKQKKTIFSNYGGLKSFKLLVYFVFSKIYISQVYSTWY